MFEKIINCVEFEHDVKMASTGIGHYEFWGQVGYDDGHRVPEGCVYAIFNLELHGITSEAVMEAVLLDRYVFEDVALEWWINTRAPEFEDVFIVFDKPTIYEKENKLIFEFGVTT